MITILNISIAKKALSLVAIVAVFGPAASISWADSQDPSNTAETAQAPTVDFFVVDQSLEGFLHMLSVDAGLRFDMTEGVLGRVRQQRFSGTAEEVVDDLSAQHELDWFLFNGIYYMSSRQEALTRLVRLGNLSEDRAMSALSSAGLDQRGFPTRTTADGTAIALSGPPKYLGIAEAVLESVPDVRKAAIPETFIRVRRGVHISDESATEVSTQVVPETED